jgi:hypothetical protein
MPQATAFPASDLVGFLLGMPSAYRIAAVVLAAIFVVDLIAIVFELRRLSRRRRRIARRPITATQALVAFAGAAAFVLGACLFLAAPPELPHAEADTAPELPSVADVAPPHPAANQAVAIANALRRAGPQTIRVIEGGDDPGAAIDLPKWRTILKNAGWTSQDGGQIRILNPPGGVVVAIGMRPELQAGMDVKPEDLPTKARVLLAALYAQGIPVELRMTQMFMLRDDAMLVVCGRSLPDSPRS